MPEVLIGAGSNADPERRLRFAVQELAKRLGPVRCSSVYRGPAAGVPAADYLNLVVAAQTDAPADSVRAALREIEALAGRTRSDPAVCELDLDLLVYGERVDAERKLPRPGLSTLPFVVVPLAELAPRLRHPVTGERCADAARKHAGHALAALGALDAAR